MEELMAALQATESSLKSFEREFRQAKKEIETTDNLYEKPKRPVSSGIIDYNSAKKVVQKASPVIAFSKTQRFRTPNPDLDSSIDSTSTVESNASLSAVKTKSPTIVFGKTKRFQETKKDTNREFDLNPNYGFVKKRETAPIIKAPVVVETKTQAKKKLQLMEAQKTLKSPTKEGELRNEDSIDTIRLEDQERYSCTMSDMLSDTTEYLGPGAYNVNYAMVEARKSVGFTKAARFKTPSETGPSFDLNPKFDYIKKSTPGVKIVPETQKNEKLLKKKEEEEYYKELSNQMRNQTPIVNDLAIRSNVPGVVIKDEMENLTEEERLHRIFNELDKRREGRRLAPGAYDPKDMEEPICTVVYRKSVSPEVVRLPYEKERQPSPTRYNVQDDLVKPLQPAYSFAKEGIDKTPKLEDFDFRKPLDINLDLVKPRIPAAVVLPEHKYEGEPDLTEAKIGPGAYEPSHNLTEKRPDIGVVKFADLNENNAREKQMDPVKKDIFDADLDPNFDATKPRAPGFVYHQPVELEGPAHLPDSALHPEQWKFYDGNLNAIKPEVGDIEFAGGLTREEFMQREEIFNQFLQYQARQARKPEVGQYNVKYNAIDPEQRAPDFDKYLEREGEEINKEDMEIPGDILILNPDKPKPHMPNIKFETMVGREEEKKDENGEELLLNPTYDLVKPRTITYVDLNKQQERKNLFDKKVDENEEELILDVNYNQVEPRIKGIPDIEKLTSREDLEPNRKAEAEELIITPAYNLVKPDTSHTISMDSKTKRFPDTVKDDVGDGKQTTAQIIDYEKAFDAVKPEKNIVDFDRYAERDMTKESQKEKAIKKQLRDLKLKKTKLPVIEEEKFEKYPKDEKENEEANKATKTTKPLKKQNSVRKAEAEAEAEKEAPVENNDIEPWEDK